MKRSLIPLLFLFLVLPLSAEVTEHGSVKAYRGKETKLNEKLRDAEKKYSEESIKTFIDELGPLGRYPKDRPTNE